MDEQSGETEEEEVISEVVGESWWLGMLPVPVPDPRRKFLPIPDSSDPTRPAGIPVPVAFQYDYRTISVRPMAEGGTARVTNPNVI